MKKNLNIMVFGILIISFCLMNAGSAEVGKKGAVSAGAKEVPDKFVAFYFHGHYRCANCKKIEQYSHEAIEKFFSEQLKTGKLIFRIINIDLPENKHFVSDYRLYTRSLVIAEFTSGKQTRWKNLDKVWDYLKDRDKFYEYVRSEIEKYLGKI